MPHQSRAALGLVSTRTRNELRVRCSAVATRLFDMALQARHPEQRYSNRELARRWFGLDSDEKIIRQYRGGAMDVTLAFVLGMPVEGALEILNAAIESLLSRMTPSHITCERAQTSATIELGRVAELLDAALLDGVIDDRERTAFAARLRVLGAKCLRFADELSQPEQRSGTRG